MRVHAVVARYLPEHGAGAQWMLHEILLAVIAAGGAASVAVDAGPPYGFEGVRVERGGDRSAAESDVIVTYLRRTPRAVDLARRLGKPLVHLVHNDWTLRDRGVARRDAQIVVYNSRWLAEAVAFGGEEVVVHPPVPRRRYETGRDPAGAALLVNLSEDKGARTFYGLAAALADRRFLGVRGAYGAQDVREAPNVEVRPNAADMRPTYAETAVALMPSAYESWGRVGVEAAWSGIPTIAHPTPGLRESLGDAGIFADRDDVVAWARALRALEDPGRYEEAAARSRARAAELWRTSQAQVADLVERMGRL